MIPCSRKYCWTLSKILTFWQHRITSPSVTVNTTRIQQVNRYSYSSRNLWLAYGLANFFACLSVILGLFAFKHNDASHNNSLSNIMSICQNPNLGNIFPRCCRGVFPLPKETMRAKLMVMPDEFGSHCLKLEDEEQKVKCEACDLASQLSRSSQSAEQTRRFSHRNSIWTRGRTSRGSLPAPQPRRAWPWKWTWPWSGANTGTTWRVTAWYIATPGLFNFCNVAIIAIS